MRTERILSIVLAMVLLASAVPLAVTPAAAIYEKKIPCDVDENDELTKEELVNAILPYMLDDGDPALDDVGDAAYVYAYWDGKPKMIVDMYDRTVAFYRPIERVVTVHPDSTRPIIALGAGDKLVGLGSYDAKSLCRDAKDCPLCAATVCGGQLFKIPMVGMYHQGLNLELILSLKPDVVFAPVSYNAADSVYEKTGIPTVSIKSGGHQFDEMYRMMEFMGTLLEKEEEAEERISFFEETIGKIEEVTSEIPEGEKPKVYFSTRGVKGTGWSKITRTVNRYDPLDTAGGINVAKDVLPEKPGATSVDVSKEQIIKWNPDIIVIACSRFELEGESDIECVLSDPDLKTVNAVKNQSVYYCIYPYSYGTPADKNMVNGMYLAKLFHPDKFPDLDVEEEGNEIFKAFLRADGLFSEYADYTGWMREWLDSQM